MSTVPTIKRFIPELLESENRPMKPKEIRALLSARKPVAPSENTVRSYLQAMAKTGEVRRFSHGSYVPAGWCHPAERDPDYLYAWLRDWFAANPSQSLSLLAAVRYHKRVFGLETDEISVYRAVERLEAQGRVVSSGGVNYRAAPGSIYS